MFHAHHNMDPGFISAAVAIGKPGTSTDEERLGSEIGRRRGLSSSSQEADTQLGFHAYPPPKVTGHAKIYPMSIEWASQQIVAVVLVARSHLPGIIDMFTHGTVPGPRWSASTLPSRPLGPCRGRKEKENRQKKNTHTH